MKPRNLRGFFYSIRNLICILSKKKMKNIFFVLGISVFLFACNSGEKKTTGSVDSTKTDTLQTVGNIEFKDEKKVDIFNGYLALKDALVETNSELSAEHASKLQPMLANLDGCEDAAKFTEAIATSNDIAIQRKNFTNLSADLIALFKNNDIKSGTIFVQHCPMANNGDGGDWLTKNKEVRNPYYGDKMLTCGSVVEELKSK